MSEIGDTLKSVAESAHAARTHYQIWYTLRGADKALLDYRADIHDYRYHEFFRASSAGHYKLMFIETACIFDTDDRSNSMRKLKSLLSDAGKDSLVEHISNRLNPFSTLVSNILTIRSKLIAHKETEATPKELYEKHRIQPDDIKLLLNTTASLLNEINDSLHGKQNQQLVGESDTYEDATFEMVKVLKAGRAEQTD